MQHIQPQMEKFFLVMRWQHGVEAVLDCCDILLRTDGTHSSQQETQSTPKQTNKSCVESIETCWTRHAELSVMVMEMWMSRRTSKSTCGTRLRLGRGSYDTQESKALKCSTLALALSKCSQCYSKGSQHRVAKENSMQWDWQQQAPSIFQHLLAGSRLDRWRRNSPTIKLQSDSAIGMSCWFCLGKMKHLRQEWTGGDREDTHQCKHW